MPRREAAASVALSLPMVTARMLQFANTRCSYEQSALQLLLSTAITHIFQAT